MSPGIVRLVFVASLALALIGLPVAPVLALPSPPAPAPMTSFQDDDDWDDDDWDDDDWDDDDWDDDFDDDDFDDDDDDFVPAPPPAPVPGPAPAPAPDDDDDVILSVGNDPAFQAPIIDDDDDASTDGFRSRQVVVSLEPGADIGAVLPRHGAFISAAVPAQNLYLITIPGEPDAPIELAPFEADPDVGWAEPNYANQVPEGRPGYFFLSAEDPAQPGAAPAPPAALDLDVALACVDGTGVTVAVLDTGVDASHPLLANRIVPGGWNVLINSSSTLDLGDGQDNDGDGLVDEMTGHGTHVAGIIAQVAPGAGIMPIKVLDSDGVGDAFYVAAGVYQAIGSGADVINLSLGSTRDARVLAEAVEAAHDAGIVVVAAAGNSDREVPPEYPAIDEHAFGIAATDAQDAKSEFSNFHPDLLLSAPGTDIVSAFPGGGYVSWSGTSMAAPWVAGAAALLLAGNPDLTVAGVGDRLAASADPIPDRDSRYDGRLGAGRLNAGAAAGCTP